MNFWSPARGRWRTSLHPTALDSSRRAYLLVRPFLIALALGGGAAHGQSVLVPPLDTTDRSAAVETAADNVVGSVNGPALRRPSPQADVYPLRWGAVQFHPYLGYQVSYGDGLLQGTNAAERTAVNSISPGVYMELGPRWALDTAITRNEYSNQLFEDNTGYAVGLRGRIPGEDWTFNFGYASSLTEEVQIETATQDTLNTHLLGASAIRSFRNRLSLELGVSQDIRLSKEQSDYWTWSSINWLNYQATPKTVFGLGVGVGYNLVESPSFGTNSVSIVTNSVDQSPDWIFEHLKGRIVWKPGPKLNVQLSGGAQFIQFQDEEGTADVFPLVAASLAYQIAQPTALTASAGHAIENALQRGQFVELTSVGLGVRQRLFEHLYLDVAPGYNLRTYDSSTGATGSAREDEYFSVDVQLGAVLFKKLNSAIFYRFADNQSTEDGFTFESNQVGFRVAYRY